MKPPIFVRTLSKKERNALQTGLRSSDAFVLRRCQMLHHRPSEFGKEGTFWTLAIAADVSFEKGITERSVSGETVRATLARLGVRWQRAKRWIESPDPEYERKKGIEIG
jgi:hypothetical protein